MIALYDTASCIKEKDGRVHYVRKDEHKDVGRNKGAKRERKVVQDDLKLLDDGGEIPKS